MARRAGGVAAGAALAAALAWLGAPARAVTIDPALFLFPGSPSNATSAASAGVAFADRWLGDRPFDNPALETRRMVELTPLLEHISRQDLSAANRNFIETGAFVDVGGGWVGVPLGRAVLFGYGAQPVLRLEDNAFTRGTTAADPLNPPAAITSHTEVRETRAGAGLSFGDSSFRIGAAGEWTRRDDQYDVSERSGSPGAGARTTGFSGEAVGFQAGVRIARGRRGPHPLTLGLAGRYLPELSVSGVDVFRPAIAAPNDSTPIVATRAAGFEGGLSASAGVTPTCEVLLSAGLRSARDWSGLGARAGAGSSWSLGARFHDPDAAWSFRAGLGQEREDAVPEPRATLLGLGLAWKLEGLDLDFAALRRSIARSGAPTSYDDRVVATARVTF